MKGFVIGELLIYDPKRLSPKRKPIEIQIQEGKIIAYYPHNVPLQQKCNTVGMAEGVFNFCHTLLTGGETKDEEDKSRGWQTIFMDTCTLILSEVQQNIWIFVKLEHTPQSKYYRLGQKQDNYYLDQSFTQTTCRLFMEQLYTSFLFFYGNIRGWVFKEKCEELQQVLSAFVVRFQQVYRYEGRLDMLDILSFSMKDLRLIPLDVNSTLKFSYFKNVLQSYNQNIAHLVVYAYGILAFTSLGKESTYILSKYLFSSGEPYYFLDQHKTRMNLLPEVPKPYLSQKFGVLYNSKSIGFEENSDGVRGAISESKAQGVDLLGLGSESNRFELFDAFFEQEGPFKVSFYTQNNMFFVTFYKTSPSLNEIIFQNRYYHDNSDKFIAKINEAIPTLLKSNDPYRFVFHNCATYTGKSTIKEWKTAGFYIRNAFELLSGSPEGVVITSTQFGYWVYGMHRFSRILILLVPIEVPLSKVEEYVGKMTKEYFTRAYV